MSVLPLEMPVLQGAADTPCPAVDKVDKWTLFVRGGHAAGVRLERDKWDNGTS